LDKSPIAVFEIPHIKFGMTTLAVLGNIVLLMYYAVVKLRQLCLVPTVGCSNEVTCNALQLVKVLAATLRALFKVLA
jgi:hypothetical protein